MRRPRTSESRIVAAREVDLAQRGAGQVDAAEGGPRKASVSWWSIRHPGIVAETSDGRCV